MWEKWHLWSEVAGNSPKFGDQAAKMAASPINTSYVLNLKTWLPKLHKLFLLFTFAHTCIIYHSINTIIHLFLLLAFTSLLRIFSNTWTPFKLCQFHQFMCFLDFYIWNQTFLDRKEIYPVSILINLVCFNKHLVKRMTYQELTKKRRNMKSRRKG